MARIDIDDERWEAGWTTVCTMHDLLAERVMSTVVGGRRVVVFYGPDGALCALRDVDAGAGSLLGSGDSNVYDLWTGRALAERSPSGGPVAGGSVAVPVDAVRLRMGMVEIAVPAPVTAEAG